MYDYYFISVDKNPADISVTEKGKKEISFRSLDVFPSHAHRNCNNFIFYSGTLWKYMVDSLWMYLYVCNNVFILFKYKLFSLIKITGLEHIIISTYVFLDIESCFFFQFSQSYMNVYTFVGGDVWGEWACTIKLELLTKADENWERRLWVKGYKSDRE